MLKTVWLTDERDLQSGSVMLLGGFDGLHCGHRRLLSRAMESGLPIGAMTIIGAKELPMFTFFEREQIFKESGIDFVFELPFSEIRDMSPQEFSKMLVDNFHVKVFVCGEDFRFGKNACGKPEDLKRGGQVCVDVQPLVTVDGQKVSSNAVKKLLGAGNVERANALLGSSFFLTGMVTEDRKIGRTIGFPTANIEYPEGKFPLKQGVYETCVRVDGKTYKGITNYGARPTFDNERVLTETYLDGFEGDLYSKTLTVQFVRYLRDIQKFDDITALKAQLRADIERVRNAK